MRFEVPVSEKMTVVFDGSEYTMRRPSLGVALELEEKIEEATASGKGAMRLVMDYVSQCGLPIEVVRSLDSDQLKAVMEALTPAKKNT